MRPPDPGISILADLAVLGLTARVDGDGLRVGPRAKVTPELAARIRQHKAEVMRALRRQDEGPQEPGPGSGPFRCERFAVMQSALRRRGFRNLADKPEVVLALVEAAEEIAAKLGEGAAMNEGGKDREAGGQEAHLPVAEPLLVDAAGVGVLLGISKNMVWKLHSAGRLGPLPVRLGRCARWRLRELRAWVEAGCPTRDQWLQQG